MEVAPVEPHSVEVIGHIVASLQAHEGEQRHDSLCMSEAEHHGIFVLAFGGTAGGVDDIGEKLGCAVHGCA